MSTVSHSVTADELLKLPRGKMRYELVRGELQSMSPAGSEHGAVTLRLSTLLDRFVTDHGLGLAFGAETGFLIQRDPDTVRAPDLAFVRQDRLPPDGPPQGFWPGAPDLAVEVVSPGDVVREIDEKVAAWIEAGAEMVWVVSPRWKTVTVYRAGGAIETLTAGQTIDGGPILPGFQCPVAEIFRVGRR
jgi:Uma2 family endonuclease